MDPVVFTILAVVLAAVALYFVAQPLISKATRTNRPAGTTAEEELEELLAQRDATFQALRELNFDRRVGKITAEDFTAFEANLKESAAGSLRALDEWEARADDSLDSAMEREIKERGAALSSGRPCPKCGNPVSLSDKFCARCGQGLDGAKAPTAIRANACPKCGASLQPGDRFCAVCGQPVTEAVVA